MIKELELDVTKIEPRMKHPTIFEHFDALESGESFTILNDHDPKPLYYQLLGERGNIFTWEYLESGPDVWRVAIAKPTAEHEPTIGEIAAKDYRKLEVFKKLGIDFCCGGEKTLKSVIAEKGLDERKVMDALAQTAAVATGNKAHNFNEWSLSFLSEYLLNTHHKYVMEAGPIIERLAEKVAHRHGAQEPHLHELSRKVGLMMEDLYEHLEEEEEKLFPHVKALENGVANAEIAAELIDLLNDDHESAGDELRALRQLTNDYSLPTGACNSYTYLFEKLKEFEQDLFEHIHLENNILFPKTRALLN